MGVGHGLFSGTNFGGIGVIGGVINSHHSSVGFFNMIDDAGSRGDQIQVIFAFQPFLDDFHMQKPQEAAPEPKPQSNGGFGFKRQSRII